VFYVCEDAIEVPFDRGEDSMNKNSATGSPRLTTVLPVDLYRYRLYFASRFFSVDSLARNLCYFLI
jgi:hypothetical protein